jgi:D-3-phosphoglycerate dehydrogenase
MICAESIAKMKDAVRVVNFARGDLVNTGDIIAALGDGKVASYVTDFPNDELLGVENVVAIPHLGASTPESEDNCASMAADELKDYLENGNITNSVNFPNCSMAREEGSRICILHKNIPNILSPLTAAIAEKGLNIENMQSKSKKELAYALVDVKEDIGDDIKTAIQAVDGVIFVRVIK